MQITLSNKPPLPVEIEDMQKHLPKAPSLPVEIKDVPTENTCEEKKAADVSTPDALLIINKPTKYGVATFVNKPAQTLCWDIYEQYNEHEVIVALRKTPAS